MRVNQSDDIVPGYQLSAPIHQLQRSRAYSPISAPAVCVWTQQTDKNPFQSLLLLCRWHFDGDYMSQVSWLFKAEIEDWFWIIQGSRFHCQPEHRLCWTWVEQYYLKIHQNGLGLKSEVSKSIWRCVLHQSGWSICGKVLDFGVETSYYF